MGKTMADLEIHKVILERDECRGEVKRLSEVLEAIGSFLTTDEGEVEATEREIGLSWTEVLEMAHDNMIMIARAAVSKKG
jgi:hypothetical protein